MSMIGNTLLNEIIKRQEICCPKEILTLLNIEIVKSLNQEKTNNHDGMDVCLCRINEVLNYSLEKIPSKSLATTEKSFKVIFSGAKRPLFYYNSSENKIITLKGDRKTIGGANSRYKSEIKFTNQEILITDYDTIYLTTDGYTDQNNKERKRFGKNQFTEIL